MDAKARVLDRQGAPIAGLYAAGNDMASVMGGHYPSGGITLGPAMTFAFQEITQSDVQRLVPMALGIAALFLILLLFSSIVCAAGAYRVAAVPESLFSLAVPGSHAAVRRRSARCSVRAAATPDPAPW